MNNQNLENESPFNILEYVKENFIGLILLLVAFFIIYFVDHINQLNMLIDSTPSQISGLNSIISSPQKITKRKFKKR